jgi:hypothetical protein
MMKHIIGLIVLSIFLGSCNGKLQKVPEDKFIGTWEVKGADVTEGILIKIDKEDGVLKGRVIKKTDNKYIQLFVDSNDVFVSAIERKSNYQFKVSENKIAKALFALYGQKTSQDFEAQFIDDNTIGLAMENSDPLKSTRIYKRVSEK